jgi:hypothetical protein
MMCVLYFIFEDHVDVASNSNFLTHNTNNTPPQLP